MADDTLLMACDCSEQARRVAPGWKLTPDGILLLEDKDGLRVSLLLPDWLEAAMRQAVLAYAPPRPAPRD